MGAEMMRQKQKKLKKKLKKEKEKEDREKKRKLKKKKKNSKKEKNKKQKESEEEGEEEHEEEEEEDIFKYFEKELSPTTEGTKVERFGTRLSSGDSLKIRWSSGDKSRHSSEDFALRTGDKMADRLGERGRVESERPKKSMKGKGIESILTKS